MLGACIVCWLSNGALTLVFQDFLKEHLKLSG